MIFVYGWCQYLYNIIYMTYIMAEWVWKFNKSKLYTYNCRQKKFHNTVSTQNSNIWSNDLTLLACLFIFSLVAVLLHCLDPVPSDALVALRSSAILNTLLFLFFLGSMVKLFYITTLVSVGTTSLWSSVELNWKCSIPCQLSFWLSAPSFLKC